jgi:hypothetical protein
MGGTGVFDYFQSLDAFTGVGILEIGNIVVKIEDKVNATYFLNLTDRRLKWIGITITPII